MSESPPTEHPGCFIRTALRLTPDLEARGCDIASFIDWALEAWRRPDGPSNADWAALRERSARSRC